MSGNYFVLVPSNGDYLVGVSDEVFNFISHALPFDSFEEAKQVAQHWTLWINNETEGYVALEAESIK